MAEALMGLETGSGLSSLPTRIFLILPALWLVLLTVGLGQFLGGLALYGFVLGLYASVLTVGISFLGACYVFGVLRKLRRQRAYGI